MSTNTSGLYILKEIKCKVAQSSRVKPVKQANSEQPLYYRL
jgi:hypothetical protein